MTITIYANALPRTDNYKDGGGSTTNRVTALRSLSGVFLALDPEGVVSTWYHGNAEQAEEGIPAIRDRTELTHAIGSVLQAATEDGGLLELDLEGHRSFIVPAHHWPTFQVVPA